MRQLHPFPARMASDLCVEQLESMDSDAIVLDPMCGSGTVLCQSSRIGRRAIGFDVDPLSVLISRVATTSLDGEKLVEMGKDIVSVAKNYPLGDVVLGWIDDDVETNEFVSFWFGSEQLSALRRLAFALVQREQHEVECVYRDALLLSLSRIIVTKDRGASLGRDISHSRPHKVRETNDFDVFEGFVRSVTEVAKQVGRNVIDGEVRVSLGDARNLKEIGDQTIDAVITSPPYLNAIDYIRGHRLSLVWMGYTLRELRKIRSSSVGAERSPDSKVSLDHTSELVRGMLDIDRLPSRFQGIVRRYAIDLSEITLELARVLKRSGTMVVVIGNSCLRGVFVQNSRGMELAARRSGFKLVDCIERELPLGSRYLPLPQNRETSLGRRIRTESIMTFVRK